jgi:peroxiredoxin
MADPSAVLDAVVLDREGRGRRLGDVVGDRPAVLLFLRHFACPSCSSNAHAFVARAPEIDRLGAKLVLIGTGEPAAMAAFGERVGLFDGALQIVCDPSLEAHRRASLRRSRASTYGVRSVVRSLVLYARGHYAARRHDDGDVDQQGGLLVLDRRGETLYSHESRWVGDDASPNEVVDILLREAALATAFGT